MQIKELCVASVDVPLLVSNPYVHLKIGFITARKRSLGQGNIFTPVCYSVHGGGCMVALGGGGHAWLLLGGHAWLLWGGHAWLLRGVCMAALGGGACVVAQGGMHGCSGGVHGCSRGGDMHGIRRHTEIWSMSRQYASYWNAFLFDEIFKMFFGGHNWSFKEKTFVKQSKM